MMKKESNETKKVRTWAYINPAIKELLVQRANDERNSESEIITKALTLYLTKDVTDESELIAKMSEIIRVVQNLAARIEVSQKLDLEWYHYSLMFTPELPRDGKEKNIIQERAAKRAGEFLLSFRHRMKMMPQFLESIFGVMLEEEEPALPKDKQ
jgi:hypothetical protein